MGIGGGTRFRFKLWNEPQATVHVAMSIMVAWGFLKQYPNDSMVTCIQQRFPPLAFTHRYFPWIFSRYYELWMVKDLNSFQTCTEKHCLWTDWQFSHKVWYKVVNHDSSLFAKTKPLVHDPFILNLVNLTCYQINYYFWDLPEKWPPLLVTFSVLFCLCPNFLVFCKHHILLFFIFTKYN